MEILLFVITLCVLLVGFLLARQIKQTSEDIKLLRQDVFRISVDLDKLQTRLDDLV